jgi:hypothetical protein
VCNAVCTIGRNRCCVNAPHSLAASLGADRTRSPFTTRVRSCPVAACALIQSDAVLTANQQLMTQGSIMTSYTGSVHAPIARSVFVWWSDGSAADQLGTIYFNDDVEGNPKTKVDAQSLPLKALTDVFNGKQLPILKAASLSAIPSDHCFSLVSKVMSLHLQTENAAVRTAWITGIKEVLSRAQAASAHAAAGSTTAAGPVAAMVAGQRFVALSGLNPTTKSDVFVFYDRESSKFGVLYQTPASATGEQPFTKDETTGVPMHRVSDVFMSDHAHDTCGADLTLLASRVCLCRCLYFFRVAAGASVHRSSRVRILLLISALVSCQRSAASISSHRVRPYAPPGWRASSRSSLRKRWPRQRRRVRPVPRLRAPCPPHRRCLCNRPHRRRPTCPPRLWLRRRRQAHHRTCSRMDGCTRV